MCRREVSLTSFDTEVVPASENLFGDISVIFSVLCNRLCNHRLTILRKLERIYVKLYKIRVFFCLFFLFLRLFGGNFLEYANY